MAVGGSRENARTGTPAPPRRAWNWIPRGGTLDDASWTVRHRGICLLLWLHVVALPVIAMVRGQAPLHALAETGAMAWLAVAAEVRALGPTIRSAATTLGLMASSAAVVHVFGGTIEAHFHFFVMVAVVALYQSWVPYLLALGFVVVHHGVIGTLAPAAVYNHPQAIDHPWLWGGLHGAFIFAESVACLVYWRASEVTVASEREARLAVEQAHEDLALAQQLTGMGSWAWDGRSNALSWSDHLYVISGVDRATFVPTFSSFQELVHPEDRERVVELVTASVRTGAPLDYECRLVRGDGEVRTMHALGHAVVEDGRVVHIRGTLHDVTERQRLQEAITAMAFRDPLTGLANRRLYLEQLEQALARAATEGTACAVLFIDLDGFKGVNDRFGHAAGDDLLCEIGARLRAAVRDTDTVARFGGDEFAVLCEDAGHRVATLTAGRIERELRRPTLIEGTPVTASIGIAVGMQGANPDELLRQADEAMYEVKALSRSG